MDRISCVGTLRENCDGCDGTVRGYGNSRHDPVIVSDVFDRRDQSEIDVMCVEQRRTLCGHIEPQAEPIVLRSSS